MGTEYKTEEMDTPVTENVKSKNIEAQNMQGIWNTMKKTKTTNNKNRKRRRNPVQRYEKCFFFNKIIEEKEEMQITRQITPNRPDQKRSSP